MTPTRAATIGVMLLAMCGSLIVRAEVAVPVLTQRVTDQTATLTAEQKANLEQTLQAFEEKKGSQLAVLLVPTTAPETIEQYSLRVVEQWKLGRKNIDDGALLIVAIADRTLRIEVGYGLEGALNDAISKRIISEVITPRFKQGDFYGGIAAGVDQIIRVVDGEPLPDPERKSAGDLQSLFPVILVLAIVLGAVLRSALGRFSGAVVTGGAVTVVAWLFAGALSIALIAGAMAFMFTLVSGRMMGYGGGRGGVLGSGGFRGGFGGGGGGFGGGGASGRW